MFTKLTPQKVQHSSGYIVQTGSRESLQYINGNVLAEIKAEFGDVTTLYQKSIRIQKGGTEFLPSIEDQELILKRITDALGFLGEKYELL